MTSLSDKRSSLEINWQNISPAGSKVKCALQLIQVTEKTYKSELVNSFSVYVHLGLYSGSSLYTSAMLSIFGQVGAIPMAVVMLYIHVHNCMLKVVQKHNTKCSWISLRTSRAGV